jgi:predicted TIM-barrel fold metal-dependent hydrolase
MIDSHYHLEPALVSLEGLRASMDRASIHRMALIGTLCPPLALPGFARYVMPMFRRAVHADGGLLHRGGLAIYQNAIKPGLKVDLLGNRYDITPQPDNDVVVEAVKEGPDRFYGLIFVNPEGPIDPIQEVERIRGVPGMIGVKAHPYWHDYPVSRLQVVAELCRDLELPLLIHLGTKLNGDFKFLPENFPDLKVIYAHSGVPYGAAITRYARAQKNVFVDLSAPSYVDLRVASQAVRNAGPDKCLFGSDGPYMHAENDRFDFTPVLSTLRNLQLSDTDREKIASGNFKKAYGLSCVGVRFRECPIPCCYSCGPMTMTKVCSGASLMPRQAGFFFFIFSANAR